jgi:hypothetical protein
MPPSHCLRSRRRNQFSRFAAKGAIALLLAAFVCLASGGGGFGTTDGSPPQLIALEGDNNAADDTPDSEQACPGQLLLAAGAAAELPHRPVSLRERDAITARAQGPPVVDPTFT